MYIGSFSRGGEALVRTIGVTKVYGRHVALRDVSVEVRPGEFVFLTGESGAGKSTFLRLLYREEVPTVGEVWVGGKNLNRMKRKEVPFLRRRIGVVFQDFRLLPQKTVFDNVAFALQVIEVPRREILRRVPETLKLVGLEDKARFYPHQLSGGEQQRVALARAVVNRPMLLLADEPTGNLDPRTAMEIMGLLLEINRLGTTVIVATHNESIVNTFRKRVITLHQGAVVRDEEEGEYALEI
jgi:cell division transport system ATP-binding protein